MYINNKESIADTQPPKEEKYKLAAYGGETNLNLKSKNETPNSVIINR